MVLTVTQTFFMFTAFLWWPYRSLFILELGASKELLGMLLMIETIAQVIFQLPGGILADRIGRKKVIVLGSVLRIISPLVYLLSTSWEHTAPALLLGSAAMLSLPATNAMIAESLPMEKRSAGFAAYRTVTWMPMIITSLLGGIFMDYFGVIKGVKLCLTAALVIAFFSTIFRWRFMEETLNTSEPVKKEKSLLQNDKSNPLTVVRKIPRNIWAMIIVAALSGFAMRVMWSFMVVYAVEEVGLTKTQWGLIGTLVSIISTVLTYPGGLLADRIGRKPCIIISRVFSPLSTIGFTYSMNFLHMALVRSLGGLAQGFGGVVWGPMGGPVWQALVADLTPTESRGRIMGLMGSIAGIVSTPASWIGGYMYDNLSPKLPFQTSFFIDILGTIILIAFLKEPEKSKRAH
jgi:MFS family permease